MSTDLSIDAKVTSLARIPVLSYGFRPFFLGAALWAVLAMVLSIGSMVGRWSFAAVYGAVAWHSHELLFGYGSAVLAGFLLTAIPAWTGRRPIRGGVLLALVLLWLGGRIAFVTLDNVGLPATSAIDGLFPIVLAALALHEVVVARNWRNVPVTALIWLYAICNILFHAEVFEFGAANYTNRAAIAVLIILISLIGGRITPTFTRNWLVRHNRGGSPAEFGRLDTAAAATAAIALSAWTIIPDGWPTATLLLLGSALQAVRMARWAGARTWREPLLLILHVGYAFIPLGFILAGISSLWPEAMPASAALHAWTTGAIGVMTLAVMTRASLGHTGRLLSADMATKIIFIAAIIAALTRIAAPLLPAAALPLLVASLVSWIVAFGVFVLRYGAILMRARIQS